MVVWHCQPMSTAFTHWRHWKQDRRASLGKSLYLRTFHFHTKITLTVASPWCSLLILYIVIFGWSHITCSPMLLFCLGWPLQKNLMLRHFTSDLDESSQDCSPGKYTVDRVRLLMWCHAFKMPAMTSFNAEKCCHLVSVRAASDFHLLHPPADR